MRFLAVLLILCSLTLTLFSQRNVPQKKQATFPSDSIVPGKSSPEKQIKKSKEEKVEHLSDSVGNEPMQSNRVDTTVQNKYGDLLDDDSTYSTRYPIWIPVLESIGSNAITWFGDRYILRAEYARVGLQSWKSNFKNGWEWDVDRFGINFIGHPYSGTLTFNSGRSNGYNYFQSFAFAVGGSLTWEYLGENTRPSYNDIINTPVNGAFLGEILYRLSSNILDDRTRGLPRISREILAGILNPMRGLNRILQGKTFHRTNKEVYQKEPLNVTLYTGLHYVNEGHKDFGKGTRSELLNAQFDYGNPFELRSRKPFDFFKLRTELNFGVGRKILDNVTGYGILTGKNIKLKKQSILIGLFQHYDYWDNKTFELGSIAFGGGLFSKIPLSKTSEIYTNIHIAVIPFAGNSTHFGPDSSEFRDYNFGDGLEGKFESTVNIGKYASASFVYYYYIIRTFVGAKGNNYIGILKPRITIRLYKDLSIGFEHFVYYNDRYLRDLAAIHSARTEQKLFLSLYFEDKQRRGHYN